MPAPRSDLATTLDAAWVRTAASADRALARWRANEPDLAHLPSLQVLVDARVKDERALGALIRCAQAGEELAVQVLVRCMTPWLRGARARLAWAEPDHEELEALLVSSLVEVIARYHIDRRPVGVITGLQLGAEQKVRRAAHRRAAPGARAWDNHELSLDGMLEHLAEAGGRGNSPSPELSWQRPAEHPAVELVRLLAAALRDDSSSLDEADVRLIAQTRIGDLTCQQLAHELGTTATAVRQRKSRAERRLATWAKAEAWAIAA